MPDQPAPQALTTESRAFHLEEYKCIKAEIAATVDKYNKLKIWILTVLGAFYAWIFTNLFAMNGNSLCYKSDLTSVRITILIPLGLAFLGFVASRQMSEFFIAAGDYAGRLEGRMGEKNLGWEAAYKTVRHANRCWLRWPRWAGDSFWTLLMIGTAVLALLLWPQVPCLVSKAP